MKSLPLLLLVPLLASPTAAAEPTSMRVAVLEFVNASSEPGLEALGKGLQSMITTDLTKVAALTVVERARLQEIMSEHKLASDGLVDKTTAAKLGKLAGASHLLAGTYTVLGTTMRLDARLFSVTKGDVLLAESMSGERDAFFELQKQLVTKLVTTLGVKLDPKERAGIAKIHTADFTAFRSFAQGIAAFDQARYDDAMEALRDATRADGEFDLARVTLDEYEGLVAKIRTKAQTIELSKRELAALERDKDFQNDSQVAQRLIAIAEEKGDAKRMRRLAALTYLMGFFNFEMRNHGRISRFQDHFDLMIVRRRGAELARRYLAEATAVFPGAPLFNTGRHPPETPEKVDAAVDAMAKSLAQGLDYDMANKNRGLMRELLDIEDFVKFAVLDPRESVKLHEIAAKKIAELGAEPDSRVKLLEMLAARLFDVGDVDAASGALARASALITSPGDLEQVAKKIEELGRLSKLLAKTDKQAELRELIAASGGYLTAERAEPWLTRGKPSVALMRELAEAREIKVWFPYANPMWLIGAEPAYLIQSEFVLTTGPRTDGWKSDDIHYYHPHNMSTPDLMVVIGRGARAEADATFTLAFEKSPDFWPRSTPREVKTIDDLVLDPGRPEVTFLFGVHDIESADEHDPDTSKQFYPNPTRGYGVRLGEKAVALVEVGEDPKSEERRRAETKVKVLSEKSGGARGKSTPVRVQVKGTAVSVSVGDTTHRFTLPAAADGFLGVHIRGDGYVSLRDLMIR